MLRVPGMPRNVLEMRSGHLEYQCSQPAGIIHASREACQAAHELIKSA